MARIVVPDADRHAEYELTQQQVTIGRLAGNDIQLNDPSVSKAHAHINAVGADRWVLEDLGSANGTFVNGERIDKCELSADATVLCGVVEIHFKVDDAGSDEPFDDSEPQILASMSVPPRLDIGLADFSEQQQPASTLVARGEPPTAESPEHFADKKLRLIQLIGEKTIKTFEPDKVAEEILDIAIEYIAASHGAICLFDDVKNFTPLATRGWKPKERPRVSRTVLRQLLSDKAGVLIQCSQDAALMSLQRMSVSSTLCVPLWTTDRIMGFVSLDRSGRMPGFSESHLDLMMAIAHQAAIAIERGRERQVRSYLSQYLDGKLVHIVKSDDSQESEDPLAPAEREVTVLFSDIVSFTKISEELKPTELAKFIRDYLTAMTDVILKHGGTIDKYIGDAVMALFGAPIANEVAADAAISAALEMLQSVKEMTSPGENKHPLRTRFGISTGKVVVGNIGSSQRVEYTAIGDTVNVASRLEGFARPMEICIDEDTYEQVSKDNFEIQEIGAIDVRNRVHPVRVYNVLS